LLSALTFPKAYIPYVKACIHTYTHTYMHIMCLYDRSRLLPIQDGGAG